MICVTLQSDALIQLSYKGVLVTGYRLWKHLDAMQNDESTQNLKSHSHLSSQVCHNGGMFGSVLESIHSLYRSNQEHFNSNKTLCSPAVQ